jgi:hypothetical protein
MITTFKHRYWKILILVSCILFSCKTGIKEFNVAGEKEIEIRGVYGNPVPLWEKGYRLSELGINAVFIRSSSINQEVLSKAKEDGLKLFSEFPVLNGKGYVEDYAKAWAIDKQGERVQPASWFLGVCPTDTGFRSYRYNQLRMLLASYKLDGVWMDYFHWHAQFEEPEPILPETCFCEQCLSRFQKESGIILPSGTTTTKSEWILMQRENEWRDWRCNILAEWASDIRKIVKEKDPDMLVGLYHCPWKDEEFDYARRNILGIDYELLKPHVDVFSPMVYHARMGRSSEWVKENVDWFSTVLVPERDNYPKIWPIVQAYDNPYEILPEEFEEVLRNGLSGRATGIMMFTSKAIADNQKKTEVLKKVYLELGKEE